MEQEIISQFKERPKTKTAWKVLYFSLASFFIPQLLGIFASVVRPILDPASMVGRSETGIAYGMGGVILSLVLVIVAITKFRKAYKSGERSWIIWLGFAFAVLTCLFWVTMIVGEIIFPH